MALCFTYADDDDDLQTGAEDGLAFISFDVRAIDVCGLTWQQVDTSNLRFNCVDSFPWLSNISTFSSRHKLHNPDRRWQVLD